MTAECAVIYSAEEALCRRKSISQRRVNAASVRKREIFRSCCAPVIVWNTCTFHCHLITFRALWQHVAFVNPRREISVLLRKGSEVGCTIEQPRPTAMIFNSAFIEIWVRQELHRDQSETLALSPLRRYRSIETYLLFWGGCTQRVFTLPLRGGAR